MKNIYFAFVSLIIIILISCSKQSDDVKSVKEEEQTEKIDDKTKTQEPQYIKLKDFESYKIRGFFKTNKDECLQAIQEANQQIEKNEKDFLAFFKRGCAKYYLEDYHGAIEDFIKTNEINDKYADAYFNRANALLVISDFEYKGGFESKIEEYGFYSVDVFADYSRVIELNPKEKFAYFNRGLAHFNLALKNDKQYRNDITDEKKERLTPFEKQSYNAKKEYLQKNPNFNPPNEACLDWSKAGELGYIKAYDFISMYCK